MNRSLIDALLERLVLANVATALQSLIVLLLGAQLLVSGEGSWITGVVMATAAVVAGIAISLAVQDRRTRREVEG